MNGSDRRDEKTNYVKRYSISVVSGRRMQWRGILVQIYSDDRESWVLEGTSIQK